MLSVICFGLFLLSEVSCHENCNKLGILLYKDIGCKPVLRPGESCPVEFECDHFQTRNDSCLFKGKRVLVGEQLPTNLTYKSCNIGCFCHNSNRFTCAVLDCAEWLVPGKPGCYRTYEVDKCCSVGEKCPQVPEPVATCAVDGHIMKEGQLFYPKSTCLRCVCPKQFNGRYEAPYCEEQSCAVQIRNSEKLVNNCAPVYSPSQDVLCCPAEWICASPTDDVVDIDRVCNKNSDLTCRFGDTSIPLGRGLRRKTNIYGEQKNVVCKCELPPLLTCRADP